MSLFRVSCCVLALTLTFLAAKVCCDGYDAVVSVADTGETEERVKRQQQIRASFTSDTQQRYTLNLQGVNTGVVLNEPSLRIISIDVNDSVRYDGSSRSVFVVNEAMIETAYNDTNTFTFLDENGDVAQFGTGNAFSATNGPGTLFVDQEGSSATFSKAEGLNTQIINDVIPILPAIIRPPSPVEIIVTTRGNVMMMNLVLNIDDTNAPDGAAQPPDDIIELTGAMTFFLSDRQSIFQRRIMMGLIPTTELLISTGNSFGDPIRNIVRFSTLLPITRAGVAGMELTQYNVNNLLTMSVAGPGVLRVGKEGGQDVAFFSNINDVNMQITMELVEMQLEFRVSDSTAEILARYPPGLSGNRLVMLNGAQSFSYPDATSIRMEDTALSVFSGPNLLQRFDTGTTPTVSAFLGDQIIRSMMAPRTFDIPAGAGATLLFNMDDNEAFVYPSRNQIIGQSISAAQTQAGITTDVTTADYSLTSTPFGVATLRARVQGTAGDGVDVVQVAPGATTEDLGSGSFLSYKGMTIEILNSNGMVVRTFMGVSPLTINAQGFEYLSSPNNFTATFGGPGRLYVDPEDLPGPRRAFYTGNQAIQTFITNFVNGLPEPRIDLVRNRTSGIVSFQSNRQNLFDLNGASAVTARPDQVGVYFENQGSIINAFDVPNNARAFYSSTGNRIQVPDPNNPGSFLFDMPANQFWEFDGEMIIPQDPTMDRTFPFMNGIIYFGDSGALVAATDTINDGIYRILTNAGAIHSSTENYPSFSSTRLTVVDDKSIITYNGRAPTRLPRGGTYYTSSERNSSIFIGNTEFNARVGGIYSQLNPSSSTYNSTTGTITVTTAEGNFISSLRPGITETRSIDRNGFITYAGGEISFDPAIRGSVSGITSFVVWDGLMATMYGATDNVTFSGPGIFWFEGNTAFYSADPTTVRRITQRINSVMTTFRRPFLSRTPRIFRDKFRTVRGGFPQTIEVYEGADVMLSCSVLAANPAATISFERRFFNMTSDRFEFETIMDGSGAMITQTENTTVLTIMDIRRNDNINAFNNTGVFRCVATNIVGSDVATTTVNILEAEAPAIVTGFLPPLSFVTNSSERLITIRAGGGVNGNNLTVDFRTVTTVGGPSQTRQDDGQTIVRTLHIGCKGEGRPKADIRWFELDQDPSQPYEVLLDAMARRLINDTERDDVVITEPREGRSVLSVSLSPATPIRRRYICEAMNLAGTVLGGVDINTQNYDCESDVELGECSGTCGIGVAPRRYTACSLVNVTNVGGVTIPYEEIPPGLFPLGPGLCGFGRDPCPRISYRYFIESETDCSVTCGTGSIMRTVVCQQVTTVGNQETISTVNDSFCAGLYRPSLVMTCSDNPPCPRWLAGMYGPCSVTCGDGMRMRQVTCIQPVHNETTFELILGANNETIFMDVDEDLCLNTTRPLDSIPCEDRFPCPIRWRPEPWGPCPTSGDLRGCQRRNIVCEEFFINDYGWPGTTVNDSVCEELGLRRPHSVRNCQGYVCDFGDWVVGRGDSVCSVTCGTGGTIVQTVTCRDRQNGTILEDGFCDITKRPNEVVPCPQDLNFLRSLNCPGVCEYEPPFCPAIRIIGCDNPLLLQFAEQCCKSCPKQATPIVIPPTEIMEVNVTAMPV